MENKISYTTVYTGNTVCLVRTNDDGSTTTLSPEQAKDALNEYENRIGILIGVIGRLEQDIDEMEEKMLEAIKNKQGRI